MDGWKIDQRAVSWDGQTVAVWRTPVPTLELRVLRGGGTVWSGTGFNAMLSPDGNQLLFTASPAGELTLRNLSTGVSRPFDRLGYELAGPFVGPGSSTLLLSKNPFSTEPRAPQLLNIQSGATTPLPNVFGGALGLLAPSGRFALLPVSPEIVLADLTGAELLGASDPVSADVYIKPGAAYFCGRILGITVPQYNRGYVGATLLSQTGAFFGAPTSATITLKVDGRVLKAVTDVKPGQYVQANFNGAVRQWGIDATVTLADGRTTKGARTSGGLICG